MSDSDSDVPRCPRHVVEPGWSVVNKDGDAESDESSDFVNISDDEAVSYHRNSLTTCEDLPPVHSPDASLIIPAEDPQRSPKSDVSSQADGLLVEMVFDLKASVPALGGNSSGGGGEGTVSEGQYLSQAEFVSGKAERKSAGDDMHESMEASDLASVKLQSVSEMTKNKSGESDLLVLQDSGLVSTHASDEKMVTSDVPDHQGEISAEIVSNEELNQLEHSLKFASEDDNDENDEDDDDKVCDGESLSRQSSDVSIEHLSLDSSSHEDHIDHMLADDDHVNVSEMSMLDVKDGESLPCERSGEMLDESCATNQMSDLFHIAHAQEQLSQDDDDISILDDTDLSVKSFDSGTSNKSSDSLDDQPLHDEEHVAHAGPDDLEQQQQQQHVIDARLDALVDDDDEADEGNQDAHAEDDDDEISSADADDRCESDITGVANDDSDDFSTLTNFGDQPLVLSDGQHVYCHRPNSAVNTALTLLSIIVVAFAFGVGIGHFIGTTEVTTVPREPFSSQSFVGVDSFDSSDSQQFSGKPMPPADSGLLVRLMSFWKKKYIAVIRRMHDEENRQNFLQQSGVVVLREDLEDCRLLLQSGQTLTRGLSQKLIRLETEYAIVTANLSSAFHSRNNDTAEKIRELHAQISSLKSERDRERDVMSTVQANLYHSGESCRSELVQLRGVYDASVSENGELREENHELKVKLLSTRRVHRETESSEEPTIRHRDGKRSDEGRRDGKIIEVEGRDVLSDLFHNFRTTPFNKTLATQFFINLLPALGMKWTELCAEMTRVVPRSDQDSKTGQHGLLFEQMKAACGVTNGTGSVYEDILKAGIRNMDKTVKSTIATFEKFSTEVKKPKLMQKIRGKVTETFRKLRSKMTTHWENIQRKFDGWRNKWFKFGRKASRGQKEENTKEHHRMPSNVDSRGNEKWSGEWISSQPDLYLHETFFTGPSRPWHQHERKLAETIGRLQKIGDVRFSSLDFVEVKEIYASVHQLSDKFFDHRSVPRQLRVWLSCQELWWKDRLRGRQVGDSEGTVECSVQLLDWQVHVLCSQYKLNDKLKKSLATICKTVQQPSMPFPAQSIPNKDEHNKNGFVQKQSMDESSDKHERIHKEPTHWNEGVSKNSETWIPDLDLNLDNKTETETKFQPNSDDDPRWYFDRMSVREDSRHDPSWYLKSMNRDEWKHSTDWYVDAMKHADSRRGPPDSYFEEEHCSEGDGCELPRRDGYEGEECWGGIYGYGCELPRRYGYEGEECSGEMYGYGCELPKRRDKHHGCTEL